MTQVTERKVELDLEFGMQPDGMLRMTVHGIDPDQLEEVIAHLGLEAKAITARLHTELAAQVRAHIAGITEGEIND